MKKEAIRLPKPELLTASLGDLILRRKSTRKFSSTPLTLVEVSNILWAAYGVTDPYKRRRAVPSAGGIYPVRVYLLAGKGGVDGVTQGLYLYEPSTHSLKLKVVGDLRSSLWRACLRQDQVLIAPISLIITALFWKTATKYGARGFRYVWIDIGHIGQNVYLASAALGLGTVAVGAFLDEEVAELLKLEEGESPAYVMPVGHPAI